MTVCKVLLRICKADVVEISKLFHVTADYLLNDDYESDTDIPAIQNATREVEDLFSKKKRALRRKCSGSVYPVL